ncbi:hypothetical protein Lal_00020990 [Lupinus albus]|nr:hypothetical protein Lal_00020990 [Lupinus albus]
MSFTRSSFHEFNSMREIFISSNGRLSGSTLFMLFNLKYMTSNEPELLTSQKASTENTSTSRL